MKKIGRIVLSIIVMIRFASAKPLPNSTPIVSPLRDLSLTEALHYAEINHPLLAEGHAGIETQHGAETITRSAELPQITYQSTYQRANARLASLGASAAFTNYTSIFSLSQLLFDFGRTSELVRSSHELLISAEETSQNDLQQVLFNVYQSYFQLLEAKAAVKVQQENVRALKNHLDQAKAFFEVGTQPKIDVTQAEANLSNGQLQLAQAENTYAISETNLKAAMGIPDFPPFDVKQKLEAPPDYTITLEQAVETAYEHRPDLLALIAQRLAAEATLSANKKSYFPVFSGTASTGQIGSGYYPTNNTWSFGIQMNVPIFNGLLTEGEVQQAKGNFHNVAAQVLNLRITARQGVEQSYNNMIAAKSALKTSEDGLTYAKENFDLAEGRYRTGVGDYVQYTDALNTYLQAESNWITALGNYNISIASLHQSMGTLTDGLLLGAK